MIGVQQVVVSPRYPGLKIAIFAERLEDAIQLGHDLAKGNGYCYLYAPEQNLYEFADGVTIKCFGLSDTQNLAGKEFDQIFINGYRAISSKLVYSLLRNSFVPEKYKLQFIKE